MEFKLFGRLRDDEEQDPRDSGPSGGSLDRTVENMFQQGYSEEEIKDELEGQYSPAEISRAVNNAVTSSATETGGPQPMTPYQEGSDEEAVSPMDEGYNPDEQEESQEGLSDGQMNMDQGFQEQPQNQQNQQMQQPQPQQQQSQSLQGSQQSGTVDPAVEELIETIVAEQFQRVRNEFESVYEELDMIEEELEDLDNRVHDLEIRDDEDQEEFVQKVDEMEDHIDSYQSRIGGLEKAFQQVLPSLVDNVKELTSLVQEIKQEKGIETSTDVSEEDVEDIDMSDW